MTPKEWLALPLETRKELADKYGLAKNGNVEVVNNQVVSDGYTAQDLLRIPAGEYHLEDSGAAINHFQGAESRDQDPTDTRNHNTNILERKVDADQVIDVTAKVNDPNGNATVSKKVKVVPDQTSGDGKPLPEIPTDPSELLNASSDDSNKDQKAK